MDWRRELIVPGQENWILQRVPIAKWLSINVTLWGMTVALTAACHNFKGLITVRAFLGAFEAVCQPTFTLLSSMWYKREEQGATVVLWYGSPFSRPPPPFPFRDRHD